MPVHRLFPATIPEGPKYCVDRFMWENAMDSGDKGVDLQPKYEDEPAQHAWMNSLPDTILDLVKSFGADAHRICHVSDKVM